MEGADTVPNNREGKVDSQEFRDALEELGLSQVEAARRLRVTDRTVRYWVAGEREIPGPVEVLIEDWLRRGIAAEADDE